MILLRSGFGFGEFKVSVGIRVGVRGNRQMVVFGLVWGFGGLELR